MKRHPRSAAALIIVLLILVGLMLLGLPFLFSQRWGLSGARSVQSAQAVRIYLAAAERLGVALGAYANADAWTNTSDTQAGLAVKQYAALDLELEHMPAPSLSGGGIASSIGAIAQGVGFYGVNANPIDVARFGYSDPRIQVGLSISDESGRLDPNFLDAAGWWELFQKLGITDWDDNEVATATPTYQNPLDRDDGDHLPELCQALEGYRLHRGFYKRLEDLRSVSAQDPIFRRWGQCPQFRKRLNSAELERLRPYLSFHNSAPGRGGVTDLGTVVASDLDLVGDPDFPDAKTSYRYSRNVIDFDLSILNQGSWLQVANPLNPTKPVTAVIAKTASGGGGTQIRYPNSSTFGGAASASGGGSGDESIPETLAGLWLVVPPALNVHQMPPVIRDLDAYKHPRNSADVGQTIPDPANYPVTYFGKLNPGGTGPEFPWGYLSPRFERDDVAGGAGKYLPARERQPLDIRSDGIFRIEAAATVADAVGGIAAQSSRTTIVQALPQEEVLERRWLTQGQWGSLVAQRFTSRMTSWPNATNRITDVGPSDLDPATAPADTPKETGVSFSVLPSPGMFSADASSNRLRNLSIRWRAPLGGDAPKQSSDIFKDYRVDSAGKETLADKQETADFPSSPVAPAPGISGDVYPDGVIIRPGSQLAYKFDTNGGPLRRVSSADASLGFCHVGLWFRPEGDWPAETTPVTLMEARQSTDTKFRLTANSDVLSMLGSGLIPNESADTNLFAVVYDPKQNMIVAAYTPPCATWVGAPTGSGPLSWLVGTNTRTTDLNEDQRCLPVPGASGSLLIPARQNVTNTMKWSPAYRANRIMTCWKFGNKLDKTGSNPTRNIPEEGRWYHLQVVIGNGRPGGIGIIVDGIAGADVGMIPGKKYFDDRQKSAMKGPWPGDHLTLPALLLGPPAPPAPASDPSLKVFPKPLSGAPSAADKLILTPAAINVEMPGFAAMDTDDYASSSYPGAGLSPRDIMPAHGSVLIGDEYVRYEKISGSGTSGAPWKLENCYRGVRQDTDVDHPNKLSHYPTTEEHVKGSRILVDGYRVPLQGSGLTDPKLLFGGTTLKMDFAPGDSTDAYAIVAKVTTPGTTPGNVVVLGAPSSVLTITPGASWAKAPDHGFLRLKDSDGGTYYFHYTNKTATEVTLDVQTAPLSTSGGPLPNSDGSGFKSIPGKLPTVTIVGMEVDDTNNPLDLANFGSSGLLQLLDIADGRCEWLNYDYVLRYGGEVYFINQNGWAANERGQQRTPFTTTVTFPTGTKVLPVQTKIDYRYTKVAAPGDLVTIVPQDYQAPPVVAAIRYVANEVPDSDDTANGYFAFTDALPLTLQGKDCEMIMGTGFNTLRDLTPLNAVISGGLSFDRIVDFKPSAMPRLDAHGLTEGRLVFGSEDVKRDGAASVRVGVTIDAPYAGDWLNGAGRIVRFFDKNGKQQSGIDSTARLTSLPATLDLPVYVEADQPIFYPANNARLGDLEGIMLVEIGGEVFACQVPTASDYTLLGAAIPTTGVGKQGHFAKIIGRGLLGSVPVDHAFSASPDLTQLIPEQITKFANLDLGPECLRLPVGPVRLLDDGGTTNAAPDHLSSITGSGADPKKQWFGISDVIGAPGDSDLSMKAAVSSGKRLQALMPNPAWMICDPSPAAGDMPWEHRVEILEPAGVDVRTEVRAWDPASNSTVTVAAINPHYAQVTTGAWMRGLYNSKIDPWTVNSKGLSPLVIGWWPRYSSCLPSLDGAGSSAPTSLTAAHLRSRVYPWINLPMRMHLARFDNSAPPAIRVDGTLKANDILRNSDSGVEMQVRAMAGTINGKEAVLGGMVGATTTAERGDWTQRPSQILSSTSLDSWLPLAGLFDWNLGAGFSQAAETDGIEVKISFKYTDPATTDLVKLSRNANRAPIIAGAKLRGHAPIATIAVEEAR